MSIGRLLGVGLLAATVAHAGACRKAVAPARDAAAKAGADAGIVMPKGDEATQEFLKQLLK